MRIRGNIPVEKESYPLIISQLPHRIQPIVSIRVCSCLQSQDVLGYIAMAEGSIKRIITVNGGKCRRLCNVLKGQSPFIAGEFKNPTCSTDIFPVLVHEGQFNGYVKGDLARFQFLMKIDPVRTC